MKLNEVLLGGSFKRKALELQHLLIEVGFTVDQIIHDQILTTAPNGIQWLITCDSDDQLTFHAGAPHKNTVSITSPINGGDGAYLLWGNVMGWHPTLSDAIKAIGERLAESTSDNKKALLELQHVLNDAGFNVLEVHSERPGVIAEAAMKWGISFSDTPTGFSGEDLTYLCNAEIHTVSIHPTDSSLDLGSDLYDITVYGRKANLHLNDRGLTKVKCFELLAGLDEAFFKRLENDGYEPYWDS